MKKIILLAFLTFTISSYAQQVKTDKETVRYLVKQIKSLDFKLSQNGKYLAFVGRVDDTEVYWSKEVKSNYIEYIQYIYNLNLDLYAEGHTILTDLDGKNPRGLSQVQLKYRK